MQQPEAPPPFSEIDTPIAQLGGLASGEKRLQLFEDRLRVVSTTGKVLEEIPRPDLPAAVTVTDGLVFRRNVGIRGEQRHQFPLSPDELATFVAWLRPGRELLLATLKRNFRFSIPVGILFMLTSLPWPADAESGLPALPTDIVGMGLGGTLMVIALIAWRLPHRGFFLADAVWFGAIAVDTIADVASGDSPFWLVIVLAMASAIVARVREYQRFGRRYAQHL